MKIAVMGIGGVGGYFGGHLARAYAGGGEVEVLFIARGEHLRCIIEKGLQLITEEGTYRVSPGKAADNPEAFGDLDLVLFCVKAYDLEEAAAMFHGNVTEQSTLISLLNGVDHAERLRAIFPQANVLNGCVYISAHIQSPGVVRQTGGSCQLFFGSEAGAEEDPKGLETIFSQAEINAAYRKDIRRVVWEKYCFVCPLASATTHLDKTFGEVMADEGSRRLLEGLLDEVEELGRAKGIDLPPDIHETSIEKISLFPYQTKSSMQLDFEKRRRTEISTFTGYVVRAAKPFGLSVPRHDSVFRALMEREAV